MRIATQNVGGMRGEFQRRQGPKLALIRKLVRKETDFLILTEVRANIEHVNRTRIKRNLLPTIHSFHNEAQKGVVVYSKAEHKIIEGSQREASVPGHIAAAAYNTGSTRTILVGFYGESASNDRASAKILTELKDIITELQHIYHTQTVIIAGDFNVAIHNRDSNNPNHMSKPQSTRILRNMIDEFNLTDLALVANKPWHTWFRPSNQGQSSRIDLILTSMNIRAPKVDLVLTFLDHIYLEATFNQAETYRQPAMKDFILGSEEFLIKAQDIIEQQIFLNSKPLSEEAEAEPLSPGSHLGNEEAQPPPFIDHGRDFNNTQTGHMALHTFNHLLKQLHTLHDDIGKSIAKASAQKLHEPSKQLFDLKRQLKNSNDEATRDTIHEQICDIQKAIKDDIEAKAKASHMRISNFYKSNVGKMVPETFTCIKDPKRDRNILRLEHEGRDITTPEDIVDIMHKWYESTAEKAPNQLITLDDFLQNHNLQLPQLSIEDSEELEQEFTTEEVRQALADAKVVSAPGPSGQTISIFKLLFMHAPSLMTQALNQLVFVPSLVSEKEIIWVQERKVIYIPKKPVPQSPGDYRPLSMLEVLYKIPSRILARRLTKVLPKLIGPHQHGFMQQKGIQEPSILATHLIEEADKKNKPLQLVSVDIEKAFDNVGHSVITQALRAFGVPEIMVQALRQYTLVGFARVEVNGRRGILITIRTGTGQGDPLSSILFLLATEPLNRVLVAEHGEMMYETNEGLKPGPQIFADDDLLPLSLPTPDSILPILDTYDEYTSVCGMKVNLKKTAALCINTPQDITDKLHELNIETPEHIKHLGIYLGKTLTSTIEETMTQISPKTIKRRILATTPPTDILHRATLIKTALLPIYNHVFMAIPVNSNHCETLFKEIIKFLWTKQKDGQTLQKRIRVSKHRVSASLQMGGLDIPHPEDLVKGFQLNIIQRILLKDDRNIPSLLPDLLQGLLARVGRPSLDQHITQLGPEQWKLTSRKLETENTILSQAFQAMADLLQWHETSIESWHCAAIVGHSLIPRQSLFAINLNEAQLLNDNDIFTISQLYIDTDTGTLSRTINHELISRLSTNHPWMRIKLQTLAAEINKKKHPIQDKFSLSRTSGSLLVKGDKHLSQINKKINSKKQTEKIITAPSYQTRIRDHVYRPDIDTFHQAYKILDLPWIPSKTKEIAFDILNRTIWTNNKAYKSALAPTPDCDRCDEIETMEHLLHGCDNYSVPLWAEFSQTITSGIQHLHGQPIARIQLTPREIIFNAQHPTIALHVKCPHIKNIISLIIQEIKRSIIHKRMNLNNNPHNPTPLVRIQAHLLNVLKKVHSYLTYQNTKNLKESIIFSERLITLLLERI
jgi:exonuclease III